ncbi:hypothetical protein DOK67_0000404 [Enterococcus sp. DIV0212c]|uniref:ATP-binding cassette domain-containing protein n=1 Tax=Enterococcus sp. DIV0212c TaxID=2230867 RepID=UPI001A9B8978|nr:ATP-binding cassette domain-containing protein [Enterococcus sp. DIV0212c]MBO1352954.1 ATP-binding cassette domain-containing protein [Enterococcus sp. DIV0212c]
MLRVNNIGKKYKDKYIFENLSFTVESGTMIGIVGDSGCGKTTLLNCIGQLEELTHGSIVFKGDIISKKNKKNFFKNEAGFLFQNFALIENETVKNNLEIVSNDEKKMISLLKKQGIEELLHSKVYKLSGGEQQRVALVRLLLKDPKIIFADEPTASLDNKNGEFVMQVLKNLSKQGKIVLVVTHNHEFIKYFDRVINLNKL